MLEARGHQKHQGQDKLIHCWAAQALADTVEALLLLHVSPLWLWWPCKGRSVLGLCPSPSAPWVGTGLAPAVLRGCSLSGCGVHCHSGTLHPVHLFLEMGARESSQCPSQPGHAGPILGQGASGAVTKVSPLSAQPST